MTDKPDKASDGPVEKIAKALGVERQTVPPASIQPSSDDTPSTEGGIDAAPHMGDDDSLAPVGKNETGPRVTPSTEGESSDKPLD